MSTERYIWEAGRPESGGIYTASKTAHAYRWRSARQQGFPVIASWIDEAGIGQTADFMDLWDRCISEAMRADCVILYREPGEALKGALVEVGAALACGNPVLFAGDPDGLGSFLNHRHVERCDSLRHAFQRAQAICDETGRAPVSRSQMREALSPPPQGSKEWRLVPEEPTEAMNEAAKPFRKGVGEGAERLYRAMLSAAPPLEVGEDIGSSSATRLDASCAPPESGGQAGGGEP